MIIEDLWRKILKDIHEKGSIHYKDGVEIKEILNISGWIDNPLKEIAPNYSLIDKNQYIDFLRKGVFNIEGYNVKNDALANYVVSLDDKEKIYIDYDIDTSDFVYTYPERLQAIPVAPKFDNFMVDQENQLSHMIERLKEDKGSNRAVATLYNVGLDPYFVKDIPCLNWLQALIRDDKLFLSVMFRSNDIYNAFPSNMHFISYIGMSIVEKLKEKYPSLVFDGIYYQCSSAHYYTSEINDDIIKKIKEGNK